MFTWRDHPWIVRATKLAAGALAGTSLSVALVALLGPQAGANTVYWMFVVCAGIAGLLLGTKKGSGHRFDAGFVLVFFLCEPAGRVLLGREGSRAIFLLVLVLGVVAACLFGRNTFQENGGADCEKSR